MIELYTKVGNKALLRDDPFFKFPAGEWHMRYEEGVYVGNEIVYISGTDVNDYIKGLLWADAQHLAKTHTAIIPYLPAARGDKGTPRDAIIYTNLIPDTEKIIFVDAHSEYMPEYISSQRLGPTMVNVTAADIFDQHKDGTLKNKWDGVIAPDKGAKQRAQEVADYLGVPLYQAEKVRDPETGRLSGFRCEEVPFNSKQLIVDDICDGGGTFNGLAEYLWNQGYIQKGDVDLYVTHGIFSQGFGTLEQWFGKIYTTDTIFDRNTHGSYWNEPKNLKVIEIKNYLLSLA